MTIKATISTADASIKTCRVEVRALVIGKKQVTLSVFRQLPRRHVIEPGVGLRGDLWGTVNYFWDGCGYGRSYDGHLHVVWSDHGQLFRSCVGLVTTRGMVGYRSYVGDPDGLSWLIGYSEPLPRDQWDHVPRLPCRPQYEESVVWWNARYAELAALPQLFIAV